MLSLPCRQVRAWAAFTCADEALEGARQTFLGTVQQQVPEELRASWADSKVTPQAQPTPKSLLLYCYWRAGHVYTLVSCAMFALCAQRRVAAAANGGHGYKPMEWHPDAATS